VVESKTTAEMVPMQAYLSSDNPRWQPRVEADIQRAIDDDLLRETHFFELKREVGSTPGARKETARDLASLAVDGGALLIGLEEDKANRTWTLAPQPLAGLTERVENIASLLVDPPLSIVTNEVPALTSSHGYLLVDIPESAAAPHMVDGVYYGRGDRTRVRLSDAEVLRYHSRRTSGEQLGNQLLDAEAARDPVPAADRSNGHLYIVAQPLTAPQNVAIAFVRGDRQNLLRFVNGAEQSVPERYLAELAPRPSRADTFSSRAQGTALCSASIARHGRQFDRSGEEQNVVDFEFREDGGFRVLVCRITAQWGQNPPVIMDGLGIAYVRRSIYWAARISEITNYRGKWLFGISASNLRGLSSHTFLNGGMIGEGPMYDASEYREVTQTTFIEMTQEPWAIAERLIGRLLRALGSRTRYAESIESPSRT
jgi:hypothetical protein